MIMSTYAISDIHGNLAIAQQVVRKAIEGNTIYFLGDACDRGKHGWQIIKMFLTTPNIVYLKGNHEDMLMKAMRPYFMGDDEYRYTHAFQVWSWNGSVETEADIVFDNIDRAHMYFSQLHTLKLTADYVSPFGHTIHMCHSGYEYWNAEDVKIAEQDILWDRNHYLYRAPWWYENEYNVHGHTPIPYLIEDANIDWPEDKDWDTGALYYANGCKIDIDMLTIQSHKACLLDLDTFEEIILEGDE